MDSKTDEVTWYYLDASAQTKGPFSHLHLRELISTAAISKATYLWRDGQSDWLPLSEIPSLKELISVPENSEKAAIVVEKKGEATPTAEGSPKEEEQFEDDDGTVYKWNRAVGAWVPQDVSVPVAVENAPEYDPAVMTYVEDDTDIFAKKKALQDAEAESFANALAGAAASGGDSTTVDKAQWGEEEGKSRVQEPGLGKKGKKKRKIGGAPPEDSNEKKEGWVDLKVNTSVYVTGLPLDVTVEEVVEVFSKCGIVKEDPDSHKPKVKLYSDKETGNLKGDGLVTYLRAPSVDLAIQIIDGTSLRPGDQQLMSVTAAKFEQKGNVFVKKAVTQQKVKKLKRVAEKVLGWGGFDDSKVLIPTTIVLKRMFRREELLDNENLLKEIEADVADECAKFGAVDKIKAHENHPDCVVTVKFKDRSAGLLCVEKMNGRWFGGQQIVALEDDGLVNYAKYVDEEWETKRLDKFGEELEKEES